MEIAGFVLLIAGALVVTAAKQIVTGRLGINGLIGLRFGALLMSDRAWHLGHRAARVPLALAGVILIVSGILVITLPVADEALGVVVIVGSIATIVMLVLASMIASREANRVLGEDNPDA